MIMQLDASSHLCKAFVPLIWLILVGRERRQVREISVISTTQRSRVISDCGCLVQMSRSTSHP